MKSIYLKVLLLSSLVVVNTSSAVTEGAQHLKACTFHDEVYEIIPRLQVCNAYPSFEYFILHPTKTHFSNPSHARLEPHNPECFDSHMVAQ